MCGGALDATKKFDEGKKSRFERNVARLDFFLLLKIVSSMLFEGQ